MLKTPKVTVLMSVNNGEIFLRETIDSILNQTFKDFEFLIINDASIDRTNEILEKCKDLRIKIINNKVNVGLTRSLNKGLKIAKGEYIARQDADDISLPTRLEKQVKFLDANKNVGALGSSWILIDENGRKIQICESYEGKQTVHFMCHGSVMMRKKSLEKVGYYREIFKYAQDYDLWLRLSEAFRVTNLKKPLYKLRVHQGSISSTKNEEQTLYAVLALKMSEERKKNGKDRLHGVSSHKAIKIKDQWFQSSRTKKRNIISHTYFVYGYATFKLGNYRMSFAYILNALEIFLGYFSIKSVLKQIFSKNWLIRKIEDKIIISAICKYAHGKMIDIGCGEKQYAEATKPYVTEHVGIDHVGTLHDKSKVDILGTAYDIPVENDHFDTVLCTFVLEHLEEPDKAISEAYRILKKNGYAIYSVPLFWHLHEEPRDFYRFTKYGLEYLFKKNEFKVVELTPLTGFWVTFGQEFVYYLWFLRKGGKMNPLWWIIPIVGTMIQGACFLLDKIYHPEQFTCEYLMVVRKIDKPNK